MVRAGIQLCTTDKYHIDMIINNSPFSSTRGNYLLHYSTIYKDTACCVENNILAVNRQQFCNQNIKRHKWFTTNSNLITFLLPAIHILLLSVLKYKKGEVCLWLWLWLLEMLTGRTCKEDTIDTLISWGEWGKRGLLMRGKDPGLLVSILCYIAKS